MKTEIDEPETFIGICNCCTETDQFVHPTAYDGNVCTKCFEKYYDSATGEVNDPKRAN